MYGALILPNMQIDNNGKQVLLSTNVSIASRIQEMKCLISSLHTHLSYNSLLCNANNGIMINGIMILQECDMWKPRKGKTYLT